MQSSSYEFAAIVIADIRDVTALEESLQALSIQRPRCFAVVVAQSPAEYLPVIQRICSGIEGLGHVVLLEPDISKNIGSLINCGLRYCLGHDPEFKFVFFLEKGSLIYPFFTLKMNQGFGLTDADAIFAVDDSCPKQACKEKSTFWLKVLRLFIDDEIRGNSYVVSLSFLKQHRISFHEDLACQFSRHFLLQLLQKGAKFESIGEPLSEFMDYPSKDLEVIDKSAVQRDVAEITAYIRSNNFILKGDVVSSIGRLIPEYRNETPRQVSSKEASYALKRAKRIWKKLPLRIKDSLKTGYIRFTHAVEAFWDS